MISIKRFLDQGEKRDSRTDDLVQAALQMARLLIEGIATHAVRGRDVDFRSFAEDLKGLSQKVEPPLSALKLLEISSETLETLENYSQRTEAYLREQRQLMQSILGVLTETLADVSGNSEEAVARLQSIEQQVERASRLDDIRALSAGLKDCLVDIREAAAHQRRVSAETVQRLRTQVSLAQERGGPHPRHFDISHLETDLEPEQEPPLTPRAASEYVVVVRLQRPDYIVSRFGEQAKHRMLSLISQSLKTLVGPNDRLLRWKGTSFVLFLKSSATVGEIRAELADAMAPTRPHYIELGKKTVLLAILADWVVFPQAECESLEAVFSKVDAFLESTLPVSTNQKVRDGSQPVSAAEPLSKP